MTNLTINALEELMSISKFKEIQHKSKPHTISNYFTSIASKIWTPIDSITCYHTQMTIEELYIFRLIDLLQSQDCKDEEISNRAAEALKDALEIIIERIFECQNGHYEYLLEIIEAIDHSKLKGVINIK